MSQPTLTLSEHELYFLPPGTPATAPASRVEVEVNGEMRVFLARLEWQSPNVNDRDVYFVFYCSAHEEKEVVLVNENRIKLKKSVLTMEEERQRICQWIECGHKERFWHPLDASFGVKFKSFGFADIEWRRGERRPESVCFEWHLPAEAETFKMWSRGDFLRYCQQLYQDENSELNFALNWGEKSADARDAVAFGCKHGDWQELRQLLSCVQKLITLRYGVFPRPKSEVSYWDFDLLGQIHPARLSRAPTPSLGATVGALRFAKLCFPLFGAVSLFAFIVGGITNRNAENFCR